jgi:hypothetical protein
MKENENTIKKITNVEYLSNLLPSKNELYIRKMINLYSGGVKIDPLAFSKVLSNIK